LYPRLRREVAIAIETELKLATRSEHLPALIRLLEARAGGPAREARLVATYFDTADDVLARQGLTLRVREREGRFVQTVKSGEGNRNGGAALVRDEWEDKVAGASPDPAAPHTGRFIPNDAAGRLDGLVRTDIARRTLMLCPGPRTRIEAAVDRGHIAAVRNDASEPVCEIELELKHGDIAALYDLALEMLAVAPLRIERRSKAARGFRLASLAAEPERIAAVHAGEVDLDPDMTAGAALRRIVDSCAGQIARNEDAVLAGMPEGVHQTRVGVRRLRAALSAFALLPESEHRWFSDELRWLGGALGVARNLDVFTEDLLAPAVKALGTVPGLAALNAALAERRALAYAEATEAILSPRYTALVLRLMRWSEDHGGENPSPPALARSIAEVAPEVLERRMKVVRRRAAGFSRQSPEQRHRLRIALKKLRYAVEMLGRLYDPEKTARLLRAAKRLQEKLGEANDLSMAHDLVAELAEGGTEAAAITGAGDAVLDWHGRRLRPDDDKTGKQVSRIRDSIPFW
jgi:triphosphatase